jgi:hypothetical protein
MAAFCWSVSALSYRCKLCSLPVQRILSALHLWLLLLLLLLLLLVLQLLCWLEAQGCVGGAQPAQGRRSSNRCGLRCGCRLVSIDGSTVAAVS